jgi:hypothetical protein
LCASVLFCKKLSSLVVSIISSLNSENIKEYSSIERIFPYFCVLCDFACYIDHVDSLEMEILSQNIVVTFYFSLFCSVYNFQILNEICALCHTSIFEEHCAIWISLEANCRSAVEVPGFIAEFTRGRNWTPS